MTQDQALTAALKTVAARVSPHPAPLNTARPYVTYQRISGKRHGTLNSGLGAPQATFQVDVWGDSVSSVRPLADQLMDALPGLLKVGDIRDNSDLYEDGSKQGNDTAARRASFDVTIWK